MWRVLCPLQPHLLQIKPSQGAAEETEKIVTMRNKTRQREEELRRAFTVGRVGQGTDCLGHAPTLAYSHLGWEQTPCHACPPSFLLIPVCAPPPMSSPEAGRWWRDKVMKKCSLVETKLHFTNYLFPVKKDFWTPGLGVDWNVEKWISLFTYDRKFTGQRERESRCHSPRIYTNFFLNFVFLWVIQGTWTNSSRILNQFAVDTYG